MAMAREALCKVPGTFDRGRGCEGQRASWILEQAKIFANGRTDVGELFETVAELRTIRGFAGGSAGHVGILVSGEQLQHDGIVRSSACRPSVGLRHAKTEILRASQLLVPKRVRSQYAAPVP